MGDRSFLFVCRFLDIYVILVALVTVSFAEKISNWSVRVPVLETFSSGNETFTSRYDTKYVIEDGPFGGNGGSSFTDGDEIHLHGLPSKVEVRASKYVDAVRFSYGGTAGNWHGGSGGSLHACDIDDGETIIIVQGRGSKYIDELEFIKSDGKICGPYGGTGGDVFTSSHPGCYLLYISGNAGKYLDQLTLHWECDEISR